jgi:hypothetical protein
MTGKMPDVAWFGFNPGWNSLDHKIDGYDTKYLRAEPVEALLKQARDALEDVSKHDAVISAMGTTIYKKLGSARVAIDQFLGETK